MSPRPLTRVYLCLSLRLIFLLDLPPPLCVTDTGIYDGVLGVVGPIEALAALRRAGFKPKRSLEVLMFTSEEPTRFGISCVGSRAMAGYLDPKRLDALKDILDETETGGFTKAAQSAGYGKGMTTEQIVKDARLAEDYYSAFVELHIEQGPELEEKGLDIGIVTGIAAPAALKVDFEGDGGHAGAQLMPWRNDALLAAAELALKVERLAKDTGSIDTVATTGVLQVGPGAINSVPRTAHMEVDIRDVDGERRDRIVDAVIEHAEKFATPRRVRVRTEIINRDPPAKADDAINAAVGLAVSRLKLTHQRMVRRCRLTSG